MNGQSPKLAQQIATFTISFLIFAMLAWLIISHFRHVFFGLAASTPSTTSMMSEDQYTNTSDPQSTKANSVLQDKSCGCPTCCAVSEVL